VARSATALFVATVAFEVAACVLSWGLEPLYDTLLYALYAIVQAGAGALIASRHPRNPIGWLFLWFALFNAVAADAAQGWGLRAARNGWPGGPVCEWIALWSFIPASVGVILVFLLFPNGRLLGPRWRVVAWVNVVGVALALPGWALSPDDGSAYTDGRNPFAVSAVPGTLLFTTGAVLICASLVASVAALVVRFHRSRGIERQQLKWFAFAAAVSAVALPTALALWWTVPAVRVLPALALTAQPIAACIAILRYRLYDIDVVISKTVTYGALTGLLASLYVASALVIGVAVGGESSWVTAGATLIVALAFRPLRVRVQEAVDRRFSRARYDARRRMGQFVDDLRRGRASPDDVEQALREALGDHDLQLHFRLADGGMDVDSHGQPVPAGDPEGWRRSAIERSGIVLGHVLWRPGTDEQQALLADVLDAASLAIEITRLRVELRRQLDEVQTSRARLVAVAEEERRRIERDLHDGAQQRLVSIGLALRHAQHELGTDDNTNVEHTIEGALAEIATAIEELRELARGVRPALLDAGLGPALLELAGRAPLPVEVEATTERFPPELETAAYFVACEGLTNAVKHAHAASVFLSVGRHGDSVVVRVADDGIGGASPNNGTGLTGLSDRVMAHGGTLHIDTGVGRGTTLTAEIPCAS
jgi:signal transduction histidine kinase